MTESKWQEYNNDVVIRLRCNKDNKNDENMNMFIKSYLLEHFTSTKPWKLMTLMSMSTSDEIALLTFVWN